MEVKMVPTGVKHLHKAACEYDIGVYFEANGHGTVSFSDKFKLFLVNNLLCDHVFDEGSRQYKLLKFLELVNETVGDAISDFLAVEAILVLCGMSTSDWDRLYEDAPSCQLKVQVKDRGIFKPIWDETRLESPTQLQEQIDAIVEQNGCGRAFVRPSGTEDVVRVYAEGNSEHNAQDIAQSIAKLVENFRP